VFTILNKDKPKLSTDKDRVIPIFDGKTQEETSFDQYVRDLGNKRPNNWSKI
jgi:hypothetical protein